MLLKIFQISSLLILTLSSTLNAKNGYGVIPIWGEEAFLGKEQRLDRSTGIKKAVWSDCGGGQDANESGIDTAHREMSEESAGVLAKYVTKAAIQQAELKGHYADHHHAPSGNFYRVYFVSVAGKKPSIQDFHRSAKKLGRHSHVEKEEWGYFNIYSLMNAPQNNRIIPGTNAEIYGPMNAIIRNAAAQPPLVNHINSLKNLPAPKPQPKPSPQKKPPQIKKRSAGKVRPVGRTTSKAKQARQVKKKPTLLAKKTHQVKKRSAIKIKQTPHIKKRTAIKRSKTRQLKRRK